jgi:hypothetical protein
MTLAEKWMPLVEHIVAHHLFGTSNRVTVQPVFRPNDTHTLYFRVCMEVIQANGRMFHIVSTPGVALMEQDCFTKAKIIMAAKSACKYVSLQYETQRLMESAFSNLMVNQIRSPKLSPTGRVLYG